MKRTAKHATETIASILAAILAAILTTAALAGCGARGEGTFEPDPRTSTACKRWSNTSMRECVVELQDTRRVTCVSSTAGMSCDWAHADGADKMSYNVVTQEGVRTFEDIDDAGDYAQSMSLRTGEPVKVFHAETGLVAFTVRPTTKDTK